MSKNAERKIEALFFREDFRRAQPDDIGSIAYATEAAEQYRAGFLDSVDAPRVQHARFRLVVDYGHGPTATILPDLLDALGCEVLALNANATDNLPGAPTTDNLNESLRRVGAITAALGMDLGAVIDASGETLQLVDEQGNAIPPMAAFAAMASLAFQAVEGATVAAPVTASHVLEKIAARHNGTIIRTRVDRQALMAAKEGVRLAGDGEGGFIIPRFQNTFDAMIALAKLLELLAATGSTLTKAVRGLPAYFIGSADVPCAWDQKGKVMRVLNESYGNGRTGSSVDGIRIDLGEEWVLVLPDADRPFFHIVAEGRTQRSANSLAEKYASIVNGLQR
jgi:mannose-1-phosphate guanylyltransferase/phosphomannomutase